MSLRRNIHLKDHLTISVVSSLKLSQFDGKLMFMLTDHARDLRQNRSQLPIELSRTC